MTRSCLAIILAAGDGTRMRSSKPKVMHELAGGTLLSHVMRAVQAAGVDDCAIVLAPHHEEAAREAKAQMPEAQIYYQHERKGTAHAVLEAKAAIEKGYDNILVLFGDTPLIKAETLKKLRSILEEGAEIGVLGFEATPPHQYGRLLMAGNKLMAIREDKDASAQEKSIALCNAGLMAISGKYALSLLEAVEAKNAKGEYYLTDIVEIAGARGLRAQITLADETEVMGINDRAQLAQAESVMQRQLRMNAMMAGVTLREPKTVYLSYDTKIEQDVEIGPHVVIGPGVIIEEGAVIHPFSHLTNASVGPNCSVGPYARLRPGVRLEKEVRIGNFVELKAAHLEEGAKVNHLSYVGDAHVGAGANIGAGVITCNYDGAKKHKTQIGEGAFIGSNSALVAPVKIGERAYIGSGSVITKDVEPDALAVTRPKLVEKQGWSKKFQKGE